MIRKSFAFLRNLFPIALNLSAALRPDVVHMALMSHGERIVGLKG